METTLTLTPDLVRLIDRRYGDLGGDYFGLGAVKRYAEVALAKGFTGSVDEFVELVASELYFDT
jgi:hypothetical protein